MSLRVSAKTLTACILLACVWSPTIVPPANAASERPVAAENGMVVSAQHLATEIGVDVLKRGGNAIDAAVAVGYALAVVYPAAGNLAVGVPGTVSGLEYAREKYGTMTRPALIEPAIDLAENGFILDQGDIDML